MDKNALSKLQFFYFYSNKFKLKKCPRFNGILGALSLWILSMNANCLRNSAAAACPTSLDCMNLEKQAA